MVRRERLDERFRELRMGLEGMREWMGERGLLEEGESSDWEGRAGSEGEATERSEGDGDGEEERDERDRERNKEAD